VQRNQFRVGLFGDGLSYTVPVAMKGVTLETGKSHPLFAIRDPILDLVEGRLILRQTVLPVGHKPFDVIFLVGNVPALG